MEGLGNIGLHWVTHPCTLGYTGLHTHVTRPYYRIDIYDIYGRMEGKVPWGAPSYTMSVCMCAPAGAPVKYAAVCVVATT